MPFDDDFDDPDTGMIYDIIDGDESDETMTPEAWIGFMKFIGIIIAIIIVIVLISSIISWSCLSISQASF